MCFRTHFKKPTAYVEYDQTGGGWRNYDTLDCTRFELQYSSFFFFRKMYTGRFPSHLSILGIQVKPRIPLVFVVEDPEVHFVEG